MSLFLKIYKSYNKSTNITKILLWVILFLILVSVFKQKSKEGYENKNKKLIFKDNESLYDNFYASIYDEIFHSDLKDDYQVGMIINKTAPTQKSKILDIGSGTGNIVNMMSKKGFSNIVGVDKSQSMINKSKKSFPDCNFIKGDINNSSLFQYNSFTHILCLYFTLYYIPDKFNFFNNCFNWLISGGSFVVHLVEPSMFDPIVPPANPLFLISPQRYAPKRITTSKVVFNNFVYQSDFKLNPENKTAMFVEKFTNRDEDKKNEKTFLRNEHTLYIENIETIIQIAQQVGFIVSSKMDMTSVQYEYNYLYVFQKP